MIFNMLIYVGFLVALLALARLFRKYDQLEEQEVARQGFIRELLRKTLRDKRHIARIEASALEEVFQTGTRTLGDPRQYNQKAGGKKHPAMRG